MFYPCRIDLGEESALKRGVVVLTPAESRRLLAKAVVGLPEVRWAYANGKLAVPSGGTAAFVVEELSGEKIPPHTFCVGMSADGMLTESHPDDRIYGRFYEGGEQSGLSYQDFIKSMAKGDVLIKGVNAVDSEGNAGVLLSSDMGGLIGVMYGVTTARGIKVICPVGLEKQVPSVLEAAAGWGQLDLDYSMGLRVGMCALPGVLVLTEIQALAVMAGVRVRCLGCGGIGGNEGAVVLLIEGPADKFAEALEIVGSVKGEPKVGGDPPPLQLRRVQAARRVTSVRTTG